MNKKIITTKDVQDYAQKNGISYIEAKKVLFAPVKSFQKVIEDKIVKKGD